MEMVNVSFFRFSEILKVNCHRPTINELIYLAQGIAFNIVTSANHDTNGDLLGSQIRAFAESLADSNEIVTTIITALFRN